jgi:hypothetical protein
MLNWFRRKAGFRSGTEERAAGVADPWSAVARLHELRLRDPLAILDLAHLPLAKPDVKRALELAWDLTTDESQRIAIEASYLYLGQFQPGVGAQPIEGNFPATSDPGQTAELLNHWAPWAERCEIERWTLWVEWNKFKRHESERAQPSVARDILGRLAERNDIASDADANGRHAA